MQAVPGSAKPYVTIVVPARNEEKFIGVCLDALEGQDYPRDRREVIVVDNGSNDRTVSIAESRGVRVVSKLGVLVGGVRNAGANSSTSDVLAFIDADCVAKPVWLSKAVATLATGGIGVAGGRYVPNPHGTWVETAWKTNAVPSSHEVAALPGGSMVFPRAVFEAVGGFDESLSAGEDDDICRKVRELGLSVLAVPDCYVTHLGYPTDLFSLAKRQVWHGSNQLDVAERFTEPQLLLTHATFFGVVILLAGLIMGAAPIVLLGLGAFLTAPIVLAGRRSSGRERRIVCFAQLLVIGVFFYTGRAVGLVKNYLRRLHVH